MNISIVDILNTGVTGFAFLMLYLGYRLTSDVQSKIFAQKPDTFSNIEMYKEWKSLVRNQLNNTRYFLVFSLIFFAGGLFLLIFQAENKIILSVTPIDQSCPPIVFHQGEPLTLNDTGYAMLMVKNEHNINVSNEKLIHKLNEISFSLEDQRKVTKNLVIVNANKSRDSGF
jgi:hypothetical protein